MKTNIYTTTFESPLGRITLGSTNKGLCLLEFDNEKRINNHFNQFKKYWDVEIIEEETSITTTTKNQLTAYFLNQQTTFDVPLDLVGTDFQLKVWNELQRIPFGSTRSYKEQAIAVGNLKAIRAVATANGENRISIIIPCHRVIGSDGSLTGYGGGIWRKQKLLELESTQKSCFDL
ncbi:MAG: methylated-DNA--[protein]-cysteine S-methyltransferase [Flavobacteriales bacterium]|nr:methylated-DNA--[protein]-cysteine S-methyltransferase [Flavobacteriales bacterium]